SRSPRRARSRGRARWRAQRQDSRRTSLRRCRDRSSAATPAASGWLGSSCSSRLRLKAELALRRGARADLELDRQALTRETLGRELERLPPLAVRVAVAADELLAHSHLELDLRA